MKKKNLLMTAIAIFGLATITVSQTVPSYVPTTGLVGWWPFNGNANDESGNNNNGTVNGATLTNDRFGNANKAYAFDGVNDKIVSPIINPLQANWSVSFWYRSLNNTSNFQGQNVIGLGSDMYGWGGVGFQISGQNPPGQCTTFNYLNQMYMFDASAECGGNYLGGGLYSDTTWYNVVIIKNNLNYDLIINNVMITSSVLLDIDIDQLIFGNRDISFQYFNGNVDDIGAWNRALTQQEITDLYNGCQLSVNTQPASLSININNSAQFITSSTDPTATYQWQTDLGVGFQNLNSVGQYSGTTNDTLTIVNITLSNNNQPFRCIISSGSCTDTSGVAVLTVNNNVGINEFKQDNLFSVFPNPAQSVINVKADSKLIGDVYSIYDNTGRVVLTDKLNSPNTTIELGNLSGGIYLFSVGENYKQTFKVIKE
jgi:hypothetical protein